MCNSTGRTVWSSFENIAWTTWSFQRELCKFQRWKLQYKVFEVFTIISFILAKVLPSTQKNSSQFFQWVFEHVWNYLSRYLDIPGCHGWYLACWQSRNKSFHPNKAECSEGFSVSCFITWIFLAQKKVETTMISELGMPLWEFYPQISQKSWTQFCDVIANRPHSACTYTSSAMLGLVLAMLMMSWWKCSCMELPSRFLSFFHWVPRDVGLKFRTQIWDHPGSTINCCLKFLRYFHGKKDS